MERSALFNLSHLQDSQIGSPSFEEKKRVMVGTQVLRDPALPSNGAIEHPAECDTIDGSGMGAESDDPAGLLIHNDQDPVGPQRGRFASEQIDTP